MTEQNEILKSLAEEYGFIIENEPGVICVDHIIFNDGRQYKLQHPSFMDLHSMLFNSGHTLDQAAFLHGLKCIFPENEKSPKIDEAFLNSKKNFKEALHLWSPLIRNLILQGL